MAKKSGVNIETVRYYERRGLIPQPPRTESGYRQFSDKTIKRIKFVKRAQELGFSLEEIQKLLEISDFEANFDSYEVQQFATEKIKQLEVKIADLQQIKSVLETLSKKCPGSGPIQGCPIMEKLSKGGEIQWLKE